MYRVISLLIACALILGLSGAPVQAQEQEMNAAEVVEAVYDAVEAQDLATAGEFLADDVVLVLMPPPPGTDGTYVGKEAVLGWYDNLIQNNFAIEFSDAEVSGDRFTMKNLTWVDDLPVAPVEFDGAGIVQDGKVKAINWVMTPETMGKLDAAFAKLANEQAVRRYMDELWSQGDLSVADEVVSEDFVSYWAPPIEGREALKEAVAGYRAENPGIYFPIEELVVTEDRAYILNSAWIVPEGAPEGDKGEQVSPLFLVVLGLKDGLITHRWFFEAPVE